MLSDRDLADAYLVRHDPSDQHGLIARSAHEIGEERVRPHGLRAELRMELHAHEPGMARESTISGSFRRATCREAQARRLQPLLVGGVHLVAVAVALADQGRP